MVQTRLVLVIALILGLCGLTGAAGSEVASASKQINLAASPSPDPSNSANTALVPATFAFHGAGFGHGIGLSQYGAQGMALEGATGTEIVEHYYPGASVTPMPMPSNLVVGLLQDRTADARRFIALRSEGIGGNPNGLSVVIGNTKLTIPAKTPVTFALLNNQVVAYGADGIFKDGAGQNISGDSAKIYWKKQKTGNSATTVVNVSSSSNSAVSISNLGGYCAFNNCKQRYKYGFLKISPYQAGTLNITNTLRLSDEYLYGLGEMPSSWNPAALQAQAIAGRAYAYRKYQAKLQPPYRTACACQIFATTVDQNFVGFAKEYATSGTNWVAAVDATKDQVVVYQGQVIETFFSSSTGGYTQPISETWGTSGYPWLTKVDDHWSKATSNPNSKWTKTLSQAALVSKFRAAGINIKDIASFTISDHYGSGAVKQMTIVDSAGQVTSISSIPTSLQPSGPNISPSGLRSIFGLKSTYVRYISASKKTVPGAENNAPAVLQLLNVENWPAITGLPGITLATSGNIQPVQFGVSVVLSDFVSGKWVEMANTLTDSTGSWALSYPNAEPGLHKLRVTAQNSVSSVQAFSQDINLNATLTLQARAQIKNAGSVTTMYGQLEPEMKDIYVYLYRKQPKYGWVLIAKTTTNALGKFSMLAKVGSRKGPASFKVKAKNPTIGPAASLPITITIQ